MQIFLKAQDRVFLLEEIRQVDLSSMEDQIVRVLLKNNDWVTAYGFDAVEIVMATKPSAAEGTRWRFRKNAWWIHNLVGHPVMQIAAWMGFKRWAIWFHDRTAPSARDFRKSN